MRIVGILAILLLIAAAIFFYMRGETPVVENVAQSPQPMKESGQTASKSVSPEQAPEKQPPTDAVQAPKIVEKSAEKAAEKPVKQPAQQTAAIPQELPKPQIIEKTKKTAAVDKSVSTKRTQATSVPPAKITLPSPTFDIVRVDENCGLLVAGRAATGALIQVLSGETLLGEVRANSRGEWVFLSSKAMSAGAHKINITARNTDGSKAESDKLVVMQVPNCDKQLEQREQAIAILAPKKAPEKQIKEQEGAQPLSDSAAPKSAPTETTLLQLPEPVGDRSKAKDLTLNAIDYDDNGDVKLAGQGQPGKQTRVYVDNKLVGVADVDEKGKWALKPEKEVGAGTHNLRIDQVDEADTVISRVEMPFKREKAEDILLAKGGIEIRAIVQPGNSLWRIARRLYGSGIEYTVIYQANQDQIRDPDLIYPGQIFKLPLQ